MEKKIRYIDFGRPLTNEELYQYAPSVMNDVSPSENVTKKYSFFPTISVIEDLKSFGWLPYGVEQRQVYKLDRASYTKHMVVFTNPSIPPIDNLSPQVILTNSHDGRNSFQFYAGVYHNIKLTSFVVAGINPLQSIETFRIKHQGYELSEIQKVVNKVIEIIPAVYDKIGIMRETILTHDQKVVFAIEAVKQRWKDTTKKMKDVKKNINRFDIKKVDLADVIKPIRDDESESTLWNIFQIVQEKIVNGGIKYDIWNKVKYKTATGQIKTKIQMRHQTARALVNIDQKIEIKKSIWKVASDFANALKRRQRKAA